MRFQTFLVFFSNFLIGCLFSCQAQTFFWKDVEYAGKYEIVYFSDSSAFKNLFMEYPGFDLPKLNPCWRSISLNITDSNFSFRGIKCGFTIDYKFSGSPLSKKGKLYFIPSGRVLPTSVSALSRYYKFKIKSLSKEVILIKFSNNKDKSMNLLNWIEVRYHKAKPIYFEECFNDIWLILVKRADDNVSN